MKTQEILSIIALSLLGLCFLSGLVKMAMKKESHKKPYEQGCAASVFIAVVLLGISQLLTETEPYTGGDNCDYGSCTIGKSSPACPPNSPDCCTFVIGDKYVDMTGICTTESGEKGSTGCCG